ncbi:GMC family oxidoreductase N-terminal domain-containing protein [Fodinibius sp.]|uniref:GMC family oxidoreductase N-terminal domain-containing protein n=1 Tax=Fodinibius sp. TaxID=1872440 RepID=UPI0035657BEA
MVRLSLPFEQMKEHYRVVVVGSGYGGSISASRMARAGQSVCLLEKGKELHPGEYPNGEAEAAKEMQMDVEGKHIGSETGLYDFRFNEDINVFQGCGLGGTSLVNANVSLPPEDWVMASEEWPSALQADRETLDECFQLAKDMLKPTPYPGDWLTPAKLKAMESASSNWEDGAYYRPPVNVRFEEGENHVGVFQNACNGCGDCVTGCNYGAKNTTLMNYLPDAKNHGAEIFTEAAVDRIERHQEQWVVRYKIMNAGRKKFGESTNFVTADIVILAAGTLGTTEILLRSKENGLEVSDMLGQRFTGNGDFLGFGYNNDVDANAIGMGHKEPDKDRPVGPCITGIIDLRKNRYTNGRKKEGMVIEEGVIPGALSAFVPWMLAFSSKFIGKDTDRGFADFFRELWRKLRSLLGGAYRGATGNTMTYLVMTHDDGKGECFLKDDRIRINWDDVGKQSIFQKVNRNLEMVTKRLGGTYIKNPTWNKLFKHRLTTVHPLGGAIMGEDATGGVVNHKGQVFDNTNGAQTYKGLYVSDGSVIPRTLGVNPLLTISALAERNCKYIADDYGWTIDYRQHTDRPEETGDPKHGIQFTERMTGYFAPGAGDYETGYEAGKANHSPFSFVLTIRTDDLNRMLEDPRHPANIIGTVRAPMLSHDDLSVSEGKFNLFVDSPGENARYMRYRMKLHAEEGDEYFFRGYKHLHDDPGFDVWRDTTTLFMTVHDGGSEQDPVLGRGILTIKPSDFKKQITTVEVTGTDQTIDKLKYQGKFLKFFSENIVDVYL